MPGLWKKVLLWTIVGFNLAAGVAAALAILPPSSTSTRSWLGAIIYRSGAIFYLATCGGTCATMLSRPSRSRSAAACVALLGHCVMVVTGVSTILKEGQAFFSVDHILSQIVTGLGVASVVAIVARLRSNRAERAKYCSD